MRSNCYAELTNLRRSDECCDLITSCERRQMSPNAVAASYPIISTHNCDSIMTVWLQTEGWIERRDWGEINISTVRLCDWYIGYTSQTAVCSAETKFTVTHRIDWILDAARIKVCSYSWKQYIGVSDVNAVLIFCAVIMMKLSWWSTTWLLEAHAGLEIESVGFPYQACSRYHQQRLIFLFRIWRCCKH